ncbi:SGNH/GDSL hydrolase family protein [Paracoccus methylarcula]|uniref:SGNH/GDSL hydrolase family protein n=1 Tax=Paracoccus methylarcula TaxID=72022 RepID=A0A422QSG6_9RHOB|nr:SGNH/GDSL hydrolase family protein [Paracoccus methylarcula]RNF32960.1 SGNH/GDSL hydrolase family protein [Paracoccus methylarcula]
MDGTDSMLKVYRYDSLSGSAPVTVVSQIAIPWTVAGSNVRLDIKRVRFVTTITLTNMVTGEQVSLTLDYAAGTGGDCRAWGIPCILFPSTASGGVRVSRLRMVADHPIPTGKAARVVCIGDSITEASQIGPDHNSGWAYLLEDERDADGLPDVLIAARGGQLSNGAAASIAETVQLCDAKSVAVILIGTNDAVHGTGSHSAWRTNVATILSALRTRTDRIALCCLPPLTTGTVATRDAINADILGGYFPDLLPPVRFDLALSLNNDGETWNPAYQEDSVHPNVAGNAVMLDRLRIDCPEAFE